MIRKTLAGAATLLVAGGLALGGVVALGNAGIGPQTVQASVTWGGQYR